jgi:hypothetical protein
MSLTDDRPQIVMNRDKARARRSDPDESHAAADKSARNKDGSGRAVLWLVLAHGPLVGSEINEHYRSWYAANGWPRVAWDSPRKRAGELCEDGYLEVVKGSHPSRAEERLFMVTDAGKAELGVTK